MANNGMRAPTPLALSEPDVKIIVNLSNAFHTLKYELESMGFVEEWRFVMSIFHLIVMEAMSYSCAWTQDNHIEDAVEMLMDLRVINEMQAVNVCMACSAVVYDTLTMHIPFFGKYDADYRVTFNIMPADTDIMIMMPAALIRKAKNEAQNRN